jgi:hypothetical protein
VLQHTVPVDPYLLSTGITQRGETIMTGKDVYQDHTADGEAQDPGPPATTYSPGEKPFKDKSSKQGRGYNHVPGAGENPGKIEHE